MPINEHQKYPDNKKRYDRNYLRVFGEVCPNCKGKGKLGEGVNIELCLRCNTLGYIEKEKK